MNLNVIFHFLGLGALLGLSAGLSPGPLTTLVISETLLYNIRAGVKVALAPLITDLPIIVLSVLILSQLSGFQNILGVIALVGGLVVLFMGIGSMRVDPSLILIQPKKSRSFSKGIAVNFLSPHPYLFWLSVGGPLITKSNTENGLPAPLFFLMGFYLLLVGSKITLAFLSGKFKTFLKGNAYIYTMRFLGFLLCLLALFLFKDGLELLGVI